MKNWMEARGKTAWPCGEARNTQKRLLQLELSRSGKRTRACSKQATIFDGTADAEPFPTTSMDHE